MTVSRIRAPGEVSQVPPPLTLYLHLPWCVSKCPYCDFNSHKSPSRLPEEDYTRALLRDMETALPAVWGRPIQSIFIGGGTPSLFSPKSIDALLSGVRQLFNPAPGIEITMEANPDSADAKKFGEFRDIGVNRLSLGVQSFADDSLRRLKRPHDGAQAHHAAEAARLAFDNVNLDLIHALPAQSPDEAVSDVRQATAHAPTHLSLYQLTLEPGTPFHRQPPDRLPDEEKTAAMTDAVAAAAEEVGYPRYEVSAYAKARQPLSAQPELLALRRLPWRRRGGAQQDDPRRKNHPRTTLERSEPLCPLNGDGRIRFRTAATARR